MSIATTDRKAGPFAGDGVTTVFPFEFKVYDAEHLKVILTSAAGADSELMLDVDYTVSLNADQDDDPGGSVTLSAAPASGEKLTIITDQPATQEAVLNNMGGFFPKTIEKRLDWLTILVQQLEEKLSRALLASVADSGDLGTLGIAAQRALKFPYFDLNGTLQLVQAASSGSVVIGESVKDYGAVGDGVTDDTKAFEAWASSATGLMIIPPGHYRLATATGFSFNTGACVLGYGATLDFSEADPANARLRITGSAGAAISLTSDVAAKGTVLPLASVDGLEAGDLLLVHSDALVPLDAIGGTTSETIGEFVRIKSISGLNVTIEGALDAAYAVADNARVQKIIPKDRVTIAGVRIVGTGPSGADTSTLEQGISALYATNLTIRDCHIEKTDYQAISIDQCYGWTVENNVIEQAYRGSDAFANVIQYGIVPKNAASRGRIVGNRILGGKHGIVWSENSNPGVSRDVLIAHNDISGTWHAAIATHESNEQYSVVHNRIHGCERGIEVRVRKATIAFNDIRNIVGDALGDAIYLSENCNDLEIHHNVIDQARYGLRMYNVGLESGSVPSNIKITDNTFENITQRGLYLEHTENSSLKKGWVIARNRFRDIAGDFIHLNGAFDNAIIEDNLCLEDAVDSVGFGVRLRGTQNTWIRRNHFGGTLIPIRTEVSTESPPATPTNIYLLENVWEGTSGLLSSGASANVVRRGNVSAGSRTQTIANGAIRIPSGVPLIVVDTEGGAATDDLDTINGGEQGDRVTFITSSSTRDVTFKDGTGNLQLAGDFVADNVGDTITLENVGGTWREVARSNNA